MSVPIAKRVVGAWLHAYEEDAPGTQVFRRADYDFPPARGRTGYEFRADRTADYLGISPRDGTARSSCTWRVRGASKPELVLQFPDGRTEILPLMSVDRNRLVIRRA